MKCLWLLFFALGTVYGQDETRFRRELQRNPNSIETYAVYIRSLSNAQRINQIGEEAVAALGPRFNIYTAMGDAFYQIKDLRRALDAYRRAQAVNTRSATGYNRMGTVLLAMGSYRQAEVAFRAAVSYTGSVNSRANYMANLGLALENSKEWDQASRAYAEALRSNPAQTVAREGQQRLRQRPQAS